MLVQITKTTWLNPAEVEAVKIERHYEPARVIVQMRNGQLHGLSNESDDVEAVLERVITKINGGEVETIL